HPSETLQRMFDRCTEFLSSEGSMIFADSLLSSHTPDRDNEIKYWKESMRRTGLSPAEVENFLRDNQEMIDTVTQESLEQIGRKYNFQILVRRGPKDQQSPFRIVVFRREPKRDS